LAKEGNPDAFKFNKPKLENYDYSFSGIKTSVLYFIQKEVRKILTSSKRISTIFVLLYKRPSLKF
jgi:tRNA A37 threonylcarbamoyltransferase TsaD